MNGRPSSVLPTLLAGLAGLAALVASLAGFVPGLYRDRALVVAQSHGYDLGNLVVLAVLLPALVAAARGSVAGRLVAAGAVGCLLYSYVTYAFLVVLNPATPLYIAVLGLGGWAFAMGFASLDEAAADAVHLPRRAAGAYLLVLAAFFALNWLRQIAGSISSGALPPDLAAAGWPMNPVYVLDLGFVLPLMALAGTGLLRHCASAVRLAVPLLVFMALLATTILSMAVGQALDGQAVDLGLVAIFVPVALVSAALVAASVLRPSGTSMAIAEPEGI